MSRLLQPKNLKRERSAWTVMRRRCLEPKFKDFKRYGAKGITICHEWIQSFDAFLADMGPAPTQTHWLARLDVTKGYLPANCHWTTHEPQMRRRTFCRKVEINMQVMTLAEASREVGVSWVTLFRRLTDYQRNLAEACSKTRIVRKNEKVLTHQGVTLPLAQMARVTGISRTVLWHRLKQGWPLECALTEPVRKRAAPITKT